ncbi:hypothetical protein V6Z12_A01G096800 [Gossypium hirsutum]
MLLAQYKTVLNFCLSIHPAWWFFSLFTLKLVLLIGLSTTFSRIELGDCSTTPESSSSTTLFRSLKFSM